MIPGETACYKCAEPLVMVEKKDEKVVLKREGVNNTSNALGLCRIPTHNYGNSSRPSRSKCNEIPLRLR